MPRPTRHKAAQSRRRTVRLIHLKPGVPAWCRSAFIRRFKVLILSAATVLVLTASIAFLVNRSLEPNSSACNLTGSLSRAFGTEFGPAENSVLSNPTHGVEACTYLTTEGNLKFDAIQARAVMGLASGAKIRRTSAQPIRLARSGAEATLLTTEDRVALSIYCRAGSDSWTLTVATVIRPEANSPFLLIDGADQTLQQIGVTCTGLRAPT